MQKTTRFAPHNLGGYLVTGILSEGADGDKWFMYEFAVKGQVVASFNLRPSDFASLATYRDECFRESDTSMLGTNLHEA